MNDCPFTYLIDVLSTLIHKSPRYLSYGIPRFHELPFVRMRKKEKREITKAEKS